MPRFLFGPVAPSAPPHPFRDAARPLPADRFASFAAAPARHVDLVLPPTATWEAAFAALGEEPDAILTWAGYAQVPDWVWTAPVPVVALAIDWTLLWHPYRHALPLADAVLTDPPGAEALRSAGLGNPHPACLFGLGPDWFAEPLPPAGAEGADAGRDLDVLFVGSANQALQGDRRHWLGRVARLAARCRVLVADGVFGADYRRLMRRAKVVVNRTARGEANQRAFEATAAGACLVTEAGNRELDTYLVRETEWVPYAEADFEAVVDGLLGDPGRRRGIAARAASKVPGFGFPRLLDDALGRLDWDDLKQRAKGRVARQALPTPAARVWAWASASDRVPPSLPPDADPYHRGLLARSPADAEPPFRQAADGGHRVARLALAEVLIDLGRGDDAVSEFRNLLTALDAAPLSAAEADAVPAPPEFDRLRADWELAAARNPADPVAEADAKRRLLLARCHERLGGLTGDPDAFARAADLWPEYPALDAARGCALALAGRTGEAVAPLRRAVAADPFDNPAARALYQALLDTGELAGCAALAADRRLLHAAAPRLVPAEPYFAPPPPPGVTRITADRFRARFDSPDTRAALTGFTDAADTAVVLALAAHVNARRVLEVGTADGRMTANLTRWTPPDAVVFSVGLTAKQSAASSPEQLYEVPPDGRFGEHADAFGLARKVRFVTADSRAVDFSTFAPLDLAFIDGGHDAGTVRSDSLGAYHALRPGGVLAWHDWDSRTAWVEVTATVLALGFPEGVTHVAGTAVAFLVKGEGVGGTAGPDTATVTVRWEGEFAPAHSLAAVNRAAVGELVGRGQRVTAVERPPSSPVSGTVPLSDAVRRALSADPGPADAHVRHAWPPDFAPPAGPEPFVLVQPWEYGRLPKEWVEPITRVVDEVWVPSAAVRRAFVASGVPADRVAVVPNGVDADRFRPDAAPYPLATRKAVRLLFVGGLIPRKGFDALLTAYRAAFTRDDGVCLVVKGAGGETFYRGQSDPDWLSKWRADPAAPEVEALPDELSEDALPGVFAACHALVHPYRGEGFGLPVLEAMACGVPVVVTAGGATDDFVPPAAGWKIPARVSYFADEALDGKPTAGRPWWLEPDPDALVRVLKEVVADAGERERRGMAARRAALAFPWSRAAAVIEARVRELRTRTPVRFRSAGNTAGSGAPRPLPAVPRAAGDSPVSLTVIVKNEAHNLPDCLGPLRDLVGEMVVVDTGSTDDGTRRVAESLGAKVSEFPWVDDFAAARNVALDRATRPWAFWVDADDRVDPANVAKLRTLFASLRPDDLAAYAMKCVCVPDAPGGTATVVDHVRLFRRHPAVRWRFRVHEQILPGLRAVGADVRWSDIEIRHVGYVDPALRARKLDRDTRLLELELAEHPDDPFARFNLGAVLHERGKWADAAAQLEVSLRLSHPRDSIVRKAFALLVQCHAKAGDPAAAARALAAGRTHYPADAELLFLAAGLARDGGDRPEAERLYRELLSGTDAPHFGSVDAALRGPKARHNLGLLLAEAGRTAEAFDQWRRGVAEDPAFLPSWLALAEWSARGGDATGEREALRRAVGLRPDLTDLARRLQELGG